MVHPNDVIKDPDVMIKGNASKDGDPKSPQQLVVMLMFKMNISINMSLLYMKICLNGFARRLTN